MRNDVPVPAIRSDASDDVPSNVSRFPSNFRLRPRWSSDPTNGHVGACPISPGTFFLGIYPRNRDRGREREETKEAGGREDRSHGSSYLNPAYARVEWPRSVSSCPVGSAPRGAQTNHIDVFLIKSSADGRSGGRARRLQRGCRVGFSRGPRSMAARARVEDAGEKGPTAEYRSKIRTYFTIAVGSAVGSLRSRLF